MAYVCVCAYVFVFTTDIVSRLWGYIIIVAGRVDFLVRYFFLSAEPVVLRARRVDPGSSFAASLKIRFWKYGRVEITNKW